MQYKVLALAALIGLASAVQIASYRREATPLDNGYFDVYYNYDLECAYTTSYKAGPDTNPKF